MRLFLLLHSFLGLMRGSDSEASSSSSSSLECSLNGLCLDVLFDQSSLTEDQELVWINWDGLVKLGKLIYVTKTSLLFHYYFY